MAGSRFRNFAARRAALTAHYQAVIDETSRTDAEQQRLAIHMAGLRRELRVLHERLWPRAPGDVLYGVRRPRIGGPAPIPPPTRDAVPLLGRQLRYAALGVLIRAERPLSLPEIHRALHLTGYAVVGRNPVKRLADAMGYEHDHGRARRLARGVYAVGELTPARRRRAAAISPLLATVRVTRRDQP
jgi:hypothetical protein